MATRPKTFRCSKGWRRFADAAGMYIGTTDMRGLHHLVYEVVDNSVDEALAGYCDTIMVTIQRRQLGSPSSTTDAASRSTCVKATGKSALETVLTVLHAGGKFGGGGYKVSGGLHGVGVSVVNALSEQLRAEVRRDGGRFVQEFQRGHPARRRSRRSARRSHASTAPRSRFLADATIFDSLDYDFGTLAQRFREMCYLTKGLKIRFVDERDDQEYSFYFEGGIVSFVRHLNKNRQVVHSRPIYAERADQRHQRRGRAPVLRRPERGRVLLRQQHQHHRRRHPSDGLPPGAHPHPERVRPQGRHPQGQRPEPDRRGCPRGADGDRQREAARAAVRGADQDAPRQLRGHARWSRRSPPRRWSSTSKRTRPMPGGSSSSACARPVPARRRARRRSW